MTVAARVTDGPTLSSTITTNDSTLQELKESKTHWTKTFTSTVSLGLIVNSDSSLRNVPGSKPKWYRYGCHICPSSVLVIAEAVSHELSEQNQNPDSDRLQRLRASPTGAQLAALGSKRSHRTVAKRSELAETAAEGKLVRRPACAAFRQPAFAKEARAMMSFIGLPVSSGAIRLEASLNFFNQNWLTPQQLKHEIKYRGWHGRLCSYKSGAADEWDFVAKPCQRRFANPGS
ncbi:hypothetical protein C8F01DRAFT_1231530 [Mycena amicta]|nr:hypothetical protein C8F01DRAFT_1231530 [Mycena amicta]